MQVEYSVLVCVYNTSENLAECLDSILAQTYKNFETVIIDDGSTDGSAQICDDYAGRDNRVRVIHKENEGLVLARKAALENAAGRRVLFVDSDDYVSPVLLEKIDAAFEEYGCDMVCYDIGYFYSDGRIVPSHLPAGDKLFTSDNRREIYELLLSTKFNSMCRKCFRADAFVNDIDYSYFKGFSRGEDRLMTSHLLKQIGSFFCLHEVLYYYRQSSESMTSKYSIYDLERASRSCGEILEMIKSEDLYDRETDLQFHLFCRHIFSSFLASLSTAETGKDEKLRTLRDSERTELFAWAADPISDPLSSKNAVIKFSLLRRGMYRTLLRLMKLKG